MVVLAILVAQGAADGSTTTTAATEPAGGGLTGPALPLNDLEGLLSLSGAQLARELPARTIPAPPLRAVPRARCGPGSRPLAGEQGRVPAAAVSSSAGLRGWTCNVREVSHLPTPGGFRTWRYRDARGHTCAYYDTSLSSPASAVSLLAGPSPGVDVVDVTHPGHPRVTATLTSLAMLSPHESLNLNARRGLLGAEVGNALSLPGTMDLYDVRHDCRHPRLLSQTPIATGHESGFSPDGKTFWVAGGAGYLYAFDVSHPRHPRELWKGAYYSHGINLSADGDTLFQTDPINGNVGLLDVSQIQHRAAHPQVHDISRSTWSTVSVPQNTVPFTRGGRHYLLEFDEFAFRFNPVTVTDRVGAARIIDITHPRRPRIVSNLRLAVNTPAGHRAADGDPTPLVSSLALGNSFHYCALPTSHDPTIVACTATSSGLRVFDIRDLAHPREAGYFVSPPRSRTSVGPLAGDAAVSQPAFDARRHQIYYTDAGTGFYALQLDRRSWPR